MEEVCRSYHKCSLKPHTGKRCKQMIRESDAQWCQVQWDWNTHKLMNKWCHNITETKAPSNFGTNSHFAHFTSWHSSNTIILPITCLPSAQCKLSTSKHNPEYIIFHKGGFFHAPLPQPAWSYTVNTEFASRRKPLLARNSLCMSLSNAAQHSLQSELQFLASVSTEQSFHFLFHVNQLYSCDLPTSGSFLRTSLSTAVTRISLIRS